MPQKLTAGLPVILGVNRNHDASAAIIIGQNLVAVAEAERVTGVKHARGPESAAAAIAAALRQANITAADITHVVVAETGREPIETLSPEVEAQLHAPGAAPLAKLGQVKDAAQLAFGLEGFEGISPEAELLGCCHHLAHAAGAIYQSGYERATSIVVDGYGVCCGSAAYHFDGAAISRLEDSVDQCLLGWRHMAFGYFAKEIDSKRTDILDMSGKVMGLNAYGHPDDAMVRFFREDYFRPDLADYKDTFTIVNGGRSVEVPGRGMVLAADQCSVEDQAFLDCCASMQSAFSARMSDYTRKAFEVTGIADFTFSGGCSLNVLANTDLAEAYGAEHVYFQPASGDAGLSIGAAVLGAAHANGCSVRLPGAEDWSRRSPYMGLGFVDDVGQEAIDPVIAVSDALPDSPETVAMLVERVLAKQVVGVIQGRCEVGPRALGNRSILALPLGAETRELINTKIKHREWWRPFAPICRQVDAATYFYGPKFSEYMLTTVKVRPEYHELLKSAAHDDGTARLQIIPDRSWNPLVWDILTLLEERTGCGVLINTSFNIGGKPLVNTLSDALQMLMTTRMDGFYYGGHWYGHRERGMMP